MNVLGVSSTSYGLDTKSIDTTAQAAQLASALDNSGAADQASSAASVKVSGRSQTFSELQKLQESDPAKFKQVMSQAADQLKAAAAQPGSATDAQKLDDLASKFQSAADSGNLSALHPKHGGGHRSHGASRAYGSDESGQQIAAAGTSQSGPTPQTSSALKQALDSVFGQLQQSLAANL